MDSRLKQDTLIEDALRSQPLAPIPQDLTLNIMARIQKDSRPRLFTWNDIAISVVIIFCIGALFFTTQNLPPMVIMELRKQSILAYQSFLVNARWLTPSIWFGLSAFFAALTIPYLQKQLKL